MRIAYRPTFSQFVDSYLATHFSGGVQTARRLAGGPLILLLGALTMVAANAWLSTSWLRLALTLLGGLFALYGLLLTLLPIINIFLVWLRRDQVLGGEEALTVLKLTRDQLLVTENGEQVELPLRRIKSIQHRSQGTWILTEGDFLISIPRHGLLEGEHDAFVYALEQAMAYQDAKN